MENREEPSRMRNRFKSPGEKPEGERKLNTQPSHRKAQQMQRLDQQAAYRNKNGSRENGYSKPSKPVIIVSALVAVILLGFVIFGAFRIYGLFDSSGEQARNVSVQVSIPEGASARLIGQELEKRDVVSSQEEFLKAVEARGAETSLKPGMYQLVTGMNMDELIDKLVLGGEQTQGKLVKLTIPEGLTVQQTAETVERVLSIPAADFVEQAKSSNYIADFPFLSGTYNDSLEGYLFPKTYEIPVTATADDVIRVLLMQYVTETSNIDFGIAEARGYSQGEIMVMASLIERETSVFEERPLVSSVIYNRLNADMFLQIDAAIQYALGTPKEALSLDDLEVDSPYNVYKNKGLPPGPICSPSKSSINAAVNPEETNYIYYVSTGEAGQHYFTDNYDDFLAAKQSYKESRGQ